MAIVVDCMDFSTIDNSVTGFINGFAGQSSLLDFLMLPATKAGVCTDLQGHCGERLGTDLQGPMVAVWVNRAEQRG